MYGRSPPRSEIKKNAPSDFAGYTNAVRILFMPVRHARPLPDIMNGYTAFGAWIFPASTQDVEARRQVDPPHARQLKATGLFARPDLHTMLIMKNPGCPGPAMGLG